jgi:23S rRNA (cytidine1920-2'-O)/16S rRNA (cytidine1409-2'-O)-methyltransferase
MKKRLDILVAEKTGFSRSKAQAMIMAGQVYIDEKRVDKAGLEVDASKDIKIKELFPYVSRGALKLEKAANEFKLDFKNKIICDIGASTGGFTDYVLQNGAKKVYAIDVGHGQLAQKIRENKKVVVMEQTNIKEVDALPEPIDIFVIDVSFISLKKVLPQILTIISNFKFQISNCDVIALVKPQFEVGKHIADRYQGIITDIKIQKEVVSDIKNYAKKLGYIIEGVTESPIKGAKGNREYLLYLKANSKRQNANNK